MSQSFPPEPARSFWQRSAKITGLVVIPLVALVIAILAWRYPVKPDNPTTTQPTTARTAPSGGTAAPSPPASRHLAELEVSAGRGNVQVAGRTLTMACGTGESDDRFREVEYRLRGGYQRFTATIAATEVVAPKVKTQLQVFADTTVVSDTVLTGTESVAVVADLDGGDKLRLRLTCEHGDTVLVISDGEVHG